MDGPIDLVDLTVEIDTALRDRHRGWAAGGMFVVTAAGWTKFELTIPANAVYNTPLKMAPVRVTGGLPAELSEAHAVHLSPKASPSRRWPPCGSWRR